jgi:hypothetical protein
VQAGAKFHPARDRETEPDAAGKNDQNERRQKNSFQFPHGRNVTQTAALQSRNKEFLTRIWVSFLRISFPASFLLLRYHLF